MTTAVVLLGIVAVHMAAILWRGRTFALRIGRARDRYGRGALLRGWAMGVAVSFGLPAAVGLSLLPRPPAWEALPAQFLPLVLHLGTVGLLLPVAPLVIGMAGGTVLNVVLGLWRARTGRQAIGLGRFPDVKPTTRRELIPAFALSLSAGISEELFFRLFVPLLVAIVSGSALLGFAVATLLFGAVHRYQGWVGVIATTSVGAFLGYIYLATGELWIAMLFHAVIDINALVIRPAVSRGWRISSSAASPS